MKCPRRQVTPPGTWAGTLRLEETVEAPDWIAWQGDAPLSVHHCDCVSHSHPLRNAQQSAKGRGKQARAQREPLVKSITARRKKIQYAADNAWPPKKPENVQARTDFRIPVNRPYSY